MQACEQLEASGLAVATGLLEAEARELNLGFEKRMTTGLPRVTVKIAASLDGRVALANGESQWITGEAARADVQRLRAAASAVLTGIDTVLADDPQLNVRDPSIELLGRQPLRVVLDTRLRIAACSANPACTGQHGGIHRCGETRGRRAARKRARKWSGRRWMAKDASICRTCSRNWAVASATTSWSKPARRSRARFCSSDWPTS